MFLGHYGLALGAKGARAELPLGMLMLAAVAPDLADPLLTAVRVQADAYTHSLPAMAVYAVSFGTFARVLGLGWRSSAWLAGVAASHVLTDYLTSRIMTWPGAPLFGLHLYAHPWADFTLEAGVLLAGWLIYRRVLVPARRNSLVSLSIPVVLIGLEAAVAVGHLAG